MPKYQVFTPIEKSGKLYLPKMENGPKFAPTSGARGDMQVGVDCSGEIELTEQEAAGMVQGQLGPLYQGVPEPIGAAVGRAEKAAFEKQKAEEKGAAEAAEFAEFQAYKVAKAAKKK